MRKGENAIREELAECISEYGKDIQFFCRWLTGTSLEADELYQDTWLLVVQRQEGLFLNGNVKSYCLSVALRLWKNKRRKYGWRQRIAETQDLGVLDAASAESPEEQVLHGERKRLVQKVVDELSQRLQIVVLLFYMVNQDYLAFLVERVWQLREPTRVLDCGCGLGFLAFMLMPLLPKGSTYRGIDLSPNLIAQGQKLLMQAEWDALPEQIVMEQGDFLESNIRDAYDLVICQAVLRHIGQPVEFLEKMRQACCPGGVVACIDVNRELESDGLYIQGMDYTRLCGRDGFPAMWKTELEKQDRDYAIGIRLPLLMEQLGLKQVQYRMNDRVNIISPDQEDYEEKLQDLIITRGWTEDMEAGEKNAVSCFMNHGMTRAEAEDYCRKQREIREYLLRHREDVSIVTTGGLMISYGWK